MLWYFLTLITCGIIALLCKYCYDAGQRSTSGGGLILDLKLKGQDLVAVQRAAGYRACRTEAGFPRPPAKSLEEVLDGPNRGQDYAGMPGSEAHTR